MDTRVARTMKGAGATHLGNKKEESINQEEAQGGTEHLKYNMMQSETKQGRIQGKTKNGKH